MGSGLNYDQFARQAENDVYGLYQYLREATWEYRDSISQTEVRIAQALILAPGEIEPPETRGMVEPNTSAGDHTPHDQGSFVFGLASVVELVLTPLFQAQKRVIQWILIRQWSMSIPSMKVCSKLSSLRLEDTADRVVPGEVPYNCDEFAAPMDEDDPLAQGLFDIVLVAIFRFFRLLRC